MTELTGTTNQDIQNRINWALEGKLTPYSKSKGPRGNKEFTKLLEKYEPKGYPRDLVTDNQKYIYLKDLLGKNEVSSEIFVDLASVLKLKSETSQSTNRKPKLEFWGKQNEFGRQSKSIKGVNTHNNG